MRDAEDIFDYVIVGGGSAGCVIASRLSERPDLRVLVLEEGPTDDILFIRAPGAFFRLIGSPRSFIYTTEREQAAKGRTLYVPQGRVLGGGGSINAMIYIRGDRQDYDGWRDGGCPGWGYDDVLPYFKMAEGNQRLSEPYHGAAGPLKVSDPPYHHPFSDAIVRAAQEVGIPYNDDFNGKSQLGFGFYQATMANGERSSTARGYLRPALGRPNLTLRLNTQVRRILFESRRAVGVAVGGPGGAETRIAARRGVVLTAGALATPKILMLSGVGPAAHLQEMGIPVVFDAPSVGGNYQDHLLVPTMATTRQPISFTGQERGLNAVRHYLQWRFFRTGMLTSNVGECGGFVDLDGDGRADLQFITSPLLMGDVDREPPPGHGLTINPQMVRPRSRGVVRLRSPRIDDPILFEGNYLQAQEDVDTLVKGVKLARRMMRAPSLAAILTKEILPGPEDDIPDRVLEDFVRQYAKTVFHPVGTCRMGSDAGAVVDTRLAVRGLENLIVGDASVMPTVNSGNTNAATVMIAERCAEFVREGLAA